MLLNCQVSEFLERVLNKIKCKRVHPYIVDEINDHIEILKQNYIETGLDEDSAYKKAIAQMGNADEIGNKLNETHRYHTDWYMIILVCTIISLSTYIVFMISSNSSIDSIQGLKIYNLILATSAFIFAYFFNYKKIEKYLAYTYILFSIVIFINFILNANDYFLTLDINTSDLNIYQSTLNEISSTYIFTVLVLSYAGFAHRFIRNGINHIFLFSVISFLPIYFLATFSITVAVILAFVFSITATYCILENENFKYKRTSILALNSIVLGLPILFFMLKILSTPYGRMRLLNIFSKDKDISFILNYIKTVLRNSEFIGISSIQNNDMSLVLSLNYMVTFIISSAGWIYGLIVVVVEISIMIRMFKLLPKINDRQSKILAVAISASFLLKFLLSIALNLGFLPIATKCYIPFISYSIHSIVCDMVLIGTFLNIYRRKDIVFES